MKFNNIVKDKKILLLLLILNFIGTFFAFYTYLDHIIEYFLKGDFYLVPFFMVSFWLYLLAFFFVLYLYLDLEVPEFLAGFSFIYCFVYGFGAFLFYPLFIIFVRGLTLYHAWNVVAHGFVGLQSLLFLCAMKKSRFFYFFSFAFIFIIKDFLDWFDGAFLYFVKFDFPYTLKVVLALIIIGLQILAFYLLWKKTKRLK